MCGNRGCLLSIEYEKKFYTSLLLCDFNLICLFKDVITESIFPFYLLCIITNIVCHKKTQHIPVLINLLEL